jgi:hypothetical protein
MRVDLQPNADGAPCGECRRGKPARGIAFVPADSFHGERNQWRVPGPHPIDDAPPVILWLCDECAAQLAGDLMGALVALQR